jgi:hypothetical protein
VIILTDWFGIGETLAFNYSAAELEAVFAKADKWRFNTFRLMFDMPPDYARIEEAISIAARHGLKTVLDNGGAMNVGGYGSPEWKAAWLEISRRYKNDDRVRAYELQNETELGAVYNTIYDMPSAVAVFTDMVDALRATGDNKLVVYPRAVNFGSWVSIEIPENQRRPGIVIKDLLWSYGNSTTWEEAKANADWRFQTLQPFVEAGYPIWAAEVGVHEVSAGGGTPYDVEKQYVIYIINECLRRGYGFSWWLYSKNHWIQGSADEVIGASNYKPPPVSTNSLAPLLVPAGMLGFLGLLWAATRKKRGR